jgi:hypothetical protein
MVCLPSIHEIVIASDGGQRKAEPMASQTWKSPTVFSHVEETPKLVLADGTASALAFPSQGLL